jgi:hypothetical protein
MNATGEDERERSFASDDYFIVHAADAVWLVSTVMARHIERALDARWRPAWVRFVDIAGARIRILTATIHCIEQSGREHRDAWRAFREARRAERGWNQFDEY